MYGKCYCKYLKNTLGKYLWLIFFELQQNIKYRNNFKFKAQKLIKNECNMPINFFFLFTVPIKKTKNNQNCIIFISNKF